MAIVLLKIELKPLEKKEILSKLQSLELKSEENNALVEALRLETEYLRGNTKLGGEQGFTLNELQQISTYARTRLTKISLENKRLLREINDINTQISSLQNELSSIKQKKSLTAGEILVKLKNKAAQQIKFSLRYTVFTNASWSNTYNLHFKSLEEDLELTHKAQVYQYSGEDWNDVELVLATGNPSQDNRMPQIYPAYISFIYAQRTKTTGVRSLNAPAASVTVYEVEEEDDFSNDNKAVYKTYTSSSQQNRIEFRAPQRYSIAHGKSETINLRDLKLPARYEYQSTPIIDPSAFLTAVIKNWESLILLNGSVNVYNQGLFVGTTNIAFQTSQDSLSLSLGRDPSISVSINRIFNKEGDSFLGSDRVREYQYEITVNNRKQENLNIRVLDRIPLSQQEDIKIDYDLGQNGQMPNPKTGLIEWTLTIESGKSKTVDFYYKIRYPKDKQINW